jgi:hypothetical protein
MHMPRPIVILLSISIFTAMLFVGNLNAFASSITQIIDSTGDGTHPLSGPVGTATDSSGNVFVTGFVSNNAFKITPGGTITQIIDSTGDGTHPLSGPRDIATDSSGNVFVTGTDSNNAFKITGAAASPGQPVGGVILPVDMTALFITGTLTNAFWMVPTLGGIAGAAIALFKVRRKHI